MDQQKYSIYKEEAVDTITSALDASLSNENLREACCRALLILGGRISFSGKVITDDYVLQKAGLFTKPESDDKITIKDSFLPVLSSVMSKLLQLLLVSNTDSG